MARTVHRLSAVKIAKESKPGMYADGGGLNLFVQAGGESFARRFVEIAARDGDLIGLKTGVMPGDRVVVRGAYEVQLTAAGVTQLTLMSRSASSLPSDFVMPITAALLVL